MVYKVTKTSHSYILTRIKMRSLGCTFFDLIKVNIYIKLSSLFQPNNIVLRRTVYTDKVLCHPGDIQRWISLV